MSATGWARMTGDPKSGYFVDTDPGNAATESWSWRGREVHLDQKNAHLNGNNWITTNTRNRMRGGGRGPWPGQLDSMGQEEENKIEAETQTDNEEEPLGEDIEEEEEEQGAAAIN